MQLSGKKIILAVTGSIAAYKTPHLVRLLVKAGAEVTVITTGAAEHFVSPLSLATVSKHPVHSNVSDGAAWNNHVELGRWADVMLVAPCSANTLAKMANGLCDNLVCAVYLSAICPVLVAPAMDEDMWLHASTRNNIQKIRSYGNHIISVVHGELASGLIGEGRMAEPEDIVTYVADFLDAQHNKPLKGVAALVTAGPTYERIDPVRFVGNFSTGKMGIAIAEALAEQGAKVTLVLGPSHVQVYNANINVVKVESAQEMYDACMEVFPTTQVTVLAAAVADYRPEEKAPEKIKKQGDTLELKLTKNKDILATLGGMKKAGQFLGGFALETTNELQHATEKLKAKNADMIVLNTLRDEGAGFGHDTNKITIITNDDQQQSLPLQSKHDAAKAIVNFIAEKRHAEKTV
ncbi:MAG: bifunctional phosphopantothenoylcysteine decarboxylase/phosphopantothenate--cysteine ligase CoaBC [Sphingobacteriales bacterium]|nr:MAG: bifunctional phosphopantothenoylcysteine decarboxylase/phosphopantothenate--cysteine ligase CoaBC [Sphingobacteriales bacterium]